VPVLVLPAALSTPTAVLPAASPFRAGPRPSRRRPSPVRCPARGGGSEGRRSAEVLLRLQAAAGPESEGAAPPLRLRPRWPARGSGSGSVRDGGSGSARSGGSGGQSCSGRAAAQGMRGLRAGDGRSSRRRRSVLCSWRTGALETVARATSALPTPRPLRRTSAAPARNTAWTSVQDHGGRHTGPAADVFPVNR